SNSLKDLIEESDPEDVFSEKIYDKKLLIYLLRHGFIDEMFNHYLTYFHPGSLTEADMKFIFSVKNHERLESHYSLNNIDKIIERLNGNEFKQ
ncbi:NTPase, partial [Planococcus sp. SIMBA_143]